MHAIKTITVGTTLLALIAMTTACDGNKFHINGEITEAADSLLYFESMTLNGPVTMKTVRLDKNGSFEFAGKKGEGPEFYRLRIHNQIVNIAIDSTETVTVHASYPRMASDYDIIGSDECLKIKEIATKQMHLQTQVNAIIASPQLGVPAVEDSVERVIAEYKEAVKAEYIYAAPMASSAYFALFQTIWLGNAPSLIFNPRYDESDVKAFAAVATSWDANYPNAERGLNLHNIAIEGMKNVRLIRNRDAQVVEADRVDVSGVVDLNLKDNKGAMQRLSSLKGKVVLLDFHLFSGDGSTERIMSLREVYNKYHDRGFEIYQVSIDADEHYWQQKTAALPWISVRVDDDNANEVMSRYNVLAVPTFFLLDKNTNAHKRDVQIDDLDAEIESLL